MSEEINPADHIINIFENNWEEYFVFDSTGDRKITYRDFFSITLNGRDVLKELEIKNNIVVLLLPNSLELMFLYFTALIMGITVVPIDPNKGIQDVDEVLSQIEYDKLIHNNYKKVYPEAVDINSISNRFFNGRDVKKEELAFFKEIDFDALFMITFTSGTTALPKGVMHSFNNFYKASLTFAKALGFSKENIFYHNLPMTYMAGILNLIFVPFLAESKIVIGERFSISNIFGFWETPSEYSVNAFFLTPAIVSMLLKFDRGNAGIDYIQKDNPIFCVATAHLNKKNQELFEKKYNTKLYESYGLSETLFVSANSPDTKNRTGAGVLLEGVEVEFLEDNEIILDVPWMFLGYKNIESEDYFTKGKYLSGDIGKIDDEVLVITGRKKDLIIRGGINISPRKIEDFISVYDTFKENVILGMEDKYLGEKIVCFFIPNLNFNDGKKKKLNRSIIQRLGQDYQIDEFFQIDEVPKNINGKIDKFRLKEIYKN